MSNQTLNSVLDGLAEALAEDASITSWVADHYGEHAVHHVYIGVDQEHPPSSDDYPLIEIATGKRRRDLDTRCVVHQVMIGIFVPCRDKDDRENVHISTGVTWANELAAIVEHACVEWMHNNNLLWNPSESLPDASMGKTFRVVWSMDVSVRDLITY